MKQGVLLLNLGSPSAPNLKSVKRYLHEFLLDERVIDLPFLQRQALVRGFIVPARARASTRAYQKIWTPEGSPLVVTSYRQRDLLRECFKFPIALGMRYGKPSTLSAMEELQKAAVEQLLIIPLYPHYAASSYESAHSNAQKALSKLAYNPKSLATFPPFYGHKLYIEALAHKVGSCLKESDYLLMSYHGIPERHVRKADKSRTHCLVEPRCCQVKNVAHFKCYRHGCLETTDLLTTALSLSPERYGVSFQSRLGKEPWLRPYTDEVLSTLPSKGKRHLKVVCPSFVSDCLETLEEIAMEGKKIFLENGGESFEMISCLNTDSSWMRFLETIIEAWSQNPQLPNDE